MKGLADGFFDRGSDLGFGPVSNLSFGGMDIDVDKSWRQFQKEDADRVTVFHQHRPVSFQHRTDQAAMFDRAAVDEEMHVRAVGPGDSRCPDKSPDSQACFSFFFLFRFLRFGKGEVREPQPAFVLDGDQRQIGSVEISQTLPEGLESAVRGRDLDGREAPDHSLIRGELKADLRKGDRGQGDEVLDMGAFGLFGSEELASGRDVVEEVSDLNGGPWRSAGGSDIDDFSAFNPDLGGFRVFGIPFAGRQDHATDTGNARQGFPAESHGADLKEVFDGSDLAGGMAFQGKEGIVSAHADPVITDADQAPAAGLDFDMNKSCLRIEGVLDQFFHDAGGSFDDFAGGDLIRHSFGKDPNTIHCLALYRPKPKEAKGFPKTIGC